MKTNWKPMIVFVGIVLIVGGVVALALDPTIADQYTKPGKYVKFGVFISRGALADPNMEQWTATEVSGCGNVMAVSTATLDTKVQIAIHGYKTIETNTIQTPWSGGSGWVYGCTFIPAGSYAVEFVNYNIGGEVCFPSCSWVRDDQVVNKLLTVGSGVSLA